MVEPREITGLVLAGGRGSRMGGLDKGLQPYAGQPLVAHALQRLAPQVGTVMLSANRHLDDYARFGAPVWPDEPADFAGPLAGWLAGLSHAATPWLASVPCDAPHFPLDLVARLAAGLGAAPIVLAAVPGEDGAPRLQPVFALISVALAPSLARFLAGGGRQVRQWAAQCGAATVLFDDRDAFRNLNTLDDLGAS